MQTRSSAPAPTLAAVAATASAALQTRLMYAAPVHKLSLLIVARAWPLVKRTYLFIDLILARRRKGELAVETGASAPRRLPDLPDEIWLAIKQFATSELVLAEQDRFVFGFHGGSDDGLWDELADPEGFDFIDRIGRARLDFGHLSDCHYCEFLMYEQRGMIRTFNHYSQEIVSMLSDHRLKIACYHLVGDKTFEHADVDTDLNGEALVALVDRTAQPGSSLLPLTIMFGAVATAEPDTITAQGAPLPAGADARFARLFELMPANSKTSHNKKQSTQGSEKWGDDKGPGWKVLEVARKA